MMIEIISWADPRGFTRHWVINDERRTFFAFSEIDQKLPPIMYELRVEWSEYWNFLLGSLKLSKPSIFVSELRVGCIGRAFLFFPFGLTEDDSCAFLQTYKAYLLRETPYQYGLAES